MSILYLRSFSYRLS